MQLRTIVPTKSQQSGLTFIELVIALALGLFIAAGAAQVFIGSRASFEIIRAQSSMQESARFGMSFISDATRQAGYVNAGNVSNGNDFAANLVNVFQGINSRWPAEGEFEELAVVDGTDDAGGTIGGIDVKADTDVLRVRLQGDPEVAMQDCAGSNITSDEALYVRMVFFVSDDDQLYCRVFDGVAWADPVPLVGGIENMQVLYGLGGDPSDRFRAQRYVSAGAVPADGWREVMTVRVGLLAVSENEPLDRASLNFTVLDKDLGGIADGKSRQVFTQTIALRSNLSNT